MTDEIDQLKNIFGNFKILAAKVNNDNKNKSKNLDETEKLLEICKEEYQKLYFEQGNLRKKYDNLGTHNNRTRKANLIGAKKKKNCYPSRF